MIKMVGTNAGVTVCCEIALSSHSFLPLPLCSCHSISLFYLLTLVFTIMSARELCSLQAGVTSPPKQGQKHGQSNSEAISTKCSQVTTKSEDEGSGEEVLAVPPLFLQESGHSGGIPVDSGIYTGMFPGMVFPRMGRNAILLERFICLLLICHG